MISQLRELLIQSSEVACQYSGLSPEFLLARFFDGLSPATREIPLKTLLFPHCEACLIHPEMELSLIPQTQEMIAELFNKRWADSWGVTMNGIVSRVPFRTVLDSQEYDYGVTYERSAYLIYLLNQEVVGTAGFYQDLSKPESCYGGLFAVRERYWGSKVVFYIFRHVLQMMRDYQRVSKLEIFTSTSSDNQRVHQFYERNGFQRTPVEFTFRDEVQRCYSLGLENSSPIWSRLSSIETRIKARSRDTM